MGKPKTAAWEMFSDEKFARTEDRHSANFSLVIQLHAPFARGLEIGIKACSHTEGCSVFTCLGCVAER